MDQLEDEEEINSEAINQFADQEQVHEVTISDQKVLGSFLEDKPDLPLMEVIPTSTDELFQQVIEAKQYEAVEIEEAIEEVKSQQSAQELIDFIQAQNAQEQDELIEDASQVNQLIQELRQSEIEATQHKQESNTLNPQGFDDLVIESKGYAVPFEIAKALQTSLVNQSQENLEELLSQGSNVSPIRNQNSSIARRSLIIDTDL